ncbi:unnamed protein product [Closterium sp. NIES-65]|nr:unnamed protein product [Closterium sp. NIES-65]
MTRMTTAASRATLSVRRTSPSVGVSFRRSQAFSAVQLAFVALLAVGFTARNAAASIVYNSAGVHASNGVPVRNLGRWRAQEGEMTAGGRGLISSSSSISISDSSSGGGSGGGIGSGGEGGEIPEWARSEVLRWEAARARELGQTEEDEAERAKRAAHAEMARALWEETEAQFEGRLQEWRRQSARLQGVAQRKSEKRARRARHKWARAQGKQAHARPERSGSGVFASDTSPPTPWEENRPAGESPCSPRSTGPVINVTTLDHILSRTKYPWNQTVTLVLQASITLDHSLVLDSSFSCTIFQADTLPSEYVLEITTDTEPVLQVLESLFLFSLGPPPLPPAAAATPTLPCRSYGIQFTQASVVGRIDVFRCAYTKLDSLFATAPWDFQYHPGVIRMGMSGIGVNLTSSENIISNNDLFGAWELIYLYRGTIGATVRNNFLHDYLFSGFRCGADVHFAWDCALTTVKHNFVFSPQKKNLTGDSAGIYFCTHWFSPGNTVSCNYVIGGDHCYYLDYCTSGVEIQGGVCLQLWDGVKLNNGKRNHIRSLLMVGLGQSPGYITCFTVTVNHCRKDPGSYWEAMRKLYYDTPEINKVSPHGGVGTKPGSELLSTPLGPSPPLSTALHPSPPLSTPLHFSPPLFIPLLPSYTPLHPSPPLSPLFTPLHPSAHLCTPLHTSAPHSTLCTPLHPSAPLAKPPPLLRIQAKKRWRGRLSFPLSHGRLSFPLSHGHLSFPLSHGKPWQQHGPSASPPPSHPMAHIRQPLPRRHHPIPWHISDSLCLAATIPSHGTYPTASASPPPSHPMAHIRQPLPRRHHPIPWHISDSLCLAATIPSHGTYPTASASPPPSHPMAHIRQPLPRPHHPIPWHISDSLCLAATIPSHGTYPTASASPPPSHPMAHIRQPLPRRHHPIPWHISDSLCLAATIPSHGTYPTASASPPPSHPMAHIRQPLPRRHHPIPWHISDSLCLSAAKPAALTPKLVWPSSLSSPPSQQHSPRPLPRPHHPVSDIRYDSRCLSAAEC